MKFLKKLFRKLKIHLSRIFGLKRRVLFFDGVTLTDKKVSKKELKNKNVKNIDGFEMVDEAKLDPQLTKYLGFVEKHKSIINQIPNVTIFGSELVMRYVTIEEPCINLIVGDISTEDIIYRVTDIQNQEDFKHWIK